MQIKVTLSKSFPLHQSYPIHTNLRITRHIIVNEEKRPWWPLCWLKIKFCYHHRIGKLMCFSQMIKPGFRKCQCPHPWPWQYQGTPLRCQCSICQWQESLPPLHPHLGAKNNFIFLIDQWTEQSTLMMGSAPLTYLMVRPGYLLGRSLLMNAAT